MPPTPTDRAVSRAAALVILAGSANGQPSTDPFPAQFELSSLLPANGGDGSDGFVIRGIDPFMYSCNSVSGAGDVNGDGIDDVIVGAYRADPLGANNAGQSFVVFGGASVGASGVVELSSLDGTNGFAMNGANSFDYSGVSVSGADDVNGDGIADLIIGASGAQPSAKVGAGASYIVFGRDVFDVGDFLPSFLLSDLDGNNGFALNGVDAFDDSGASVSAAGDVNGDGFGDVIIGANRADPNGVNNAGESYIVFGSDSGALPVFELSTLNGANGFVINGIDPFTYSCNSVACAGDFNGDEIDDLIIGAYRADPLGANNSGQSYIVFGRDTAMTGNFPASFDLASLNGANGFAINGIDPFDYSGVSVSAAGDVNGDGLGDVIIGAYRGDSNGMNNTGKSYVVFGIDTSNVVIPISLNLSTLNGTNGFVLNGVDAFDYSALSVSGAGDINGDDIDDIIVGAYRADPGGRNGAGAGYIVFGRNTAASGDFPASLNLSTLDGTDGFVINGIDSGDNSFETVSAAGDVNADGIGDVIIGARFGDPNAINNAGECYILFGRNVSTLCEGDANSDGAIDFGDITDVLGNWLNDYSPGTGLGDANGDGIVDFGDITAVLGNWLSVCP